MDQPKFNKSFEALYAIAMKMADECIVNKPLTDRFEKLKEEFLEVIQAYDYSRKTATPIPNDLKEVVKELSDLLFVLIHIAYCIDKTSAYDLLHMAMTKMLFRMNDPNYVAKN